jgi:hypothetical protein
MSSTFAYRQPEHFVGLVFTVGLTLRRKCSSFGCAEVNVLTCRSELAFAEIFIDYLFGFDEATSGPPPVHVDGPNLISCIRELADIFEKYPRVQLVGQRHPGTSTVRGVRKFHH